MSATVTYRGPIRLVVFDWAGTTVDHGCFAPVTPYLEALRREGVELTAEQVRGPMGLSKRDHLQALLDLPGVAQRWQTAQGRPLTTAEGDRIFSEHFIPLQLAAVGENSRLIEGLLPTVAWLREQGIRIATTTGYFREAAQICAAVAAEQGYRPDANLVAADVRAGRPEPWMIFHHLELFGIYPPAAAVKIGDTVPDIAEGRNAGTWSVGVTQTSSDVGLTEQQWNALPDPERRALQEPVRAKLLAAGAHQVIGSVAEVPDLIQRLNEQLARGERP